MRTKSYAKKSLASAAALMVACTACAGCGGVPFRQPNGNGEKIDKSKTQLYVSNLNAGIGSDWLDELKVRFEAAYAEEQFEEGKVGVQVVIDKENLVNARWLLMPTDTWEVYFNENLPYNEFVAQKYLLDISDVVTGNAYGENDTILSKIDTTVAAGLTSYDGKYYAIPHYEAYRGISYNVEVFEENRLYLSDDEDNGNNGFVVTKSDKKSAGPNGIYGDYDDGLPSTIDEFLKLLDQMVLMGVTPFVWPGSVTEYTDYIVDAFAANLSGYTAAQSDYTFDSGENPVRVVTGFDGNGAPVIGEQKITAENGYLLKQTEGKYYALSVLEKIISNIDNYAYRLSNASSTFTQLDSQEEFYNSYLENKPIGMIVDGNYWWNESAKARERAVSAYGERASKQRFAFMPLPHKVHADSEASTTKQTLTDCMKSYAFVNANIADKPEKVRLAKLFLAFAYTDESLQEFTSVTGIAKGLKYEMEPAQYDALPEYAKSCWTLRQDADIVRQLSTSKLYMENVTTLSYNPYSSVVDGESYLYPFTGFRAKKTASAYFKGTWTSAADWVKNYSKYWAD